MSTDVLRGFLFIAPTFLAVYFAGGSIALLALLFCLSKNYSHIKYDCLALLLPPLLWLTLALLFSRKSFSELGELLVLGCTISVLSVLRILFTRKLKVAAQSYAALSLFSAVAIFLSSPLA